MKSRRSSPDPYVLDTLADDVENLESILRMLNSDTELGWVREWGRQFTREDVISALSRLVRDDHVFVVARDGGEMQQLSPRALPPESYGDAYFGITDRGRLIHADWEPKSAQS